jgi:mono/diheme cytochrome c family protein
LYLKLCWTCHGKTGQGDGPAGSGLNPKPRNFSLAEVQNQSDGELFWKLSNGRGMMIPYKHSLSQDQRWQLINFIRTFKK